MVISAPVSTPLSTHLTSGGVTSPPPSPSSPSYPPLHRPSALSLSLQNQDPLTYKRVSMSQGFTRSAPSVGARPSPPCRAEPSFPRAAPKAPKALGVFPAPRAHTRVARSVARAIDRCHGDRLWRRASLDCSPFAFTPSTEVVKM